MKFVKEHLAVLICAAVALLLLLAAFVYPIPGMVTAQQTAMKQRLALRQTIKQLTMTKLTLPGLPERQGIPSIEYIEAKKNSIQSIDNAKKTVADLSSALNAKGRVEKNVPLLPIPGTSGKPEAGFLPRLLPSVDPNQYKADYNSQFRLWTGLLSKGAAKSVELDSAMPPDPNSIKAQYDDDQRSRAGATGSSMMAAGGPTNDEFLAFEKRLVMNRAAELRMYVERTAFQVRPWDITDNAPDETQIFESLVDSWLQSDVVKAIEATNLQTDKDPTGHAIAKSAVKRLTRIVIGNNARTRLLSASTNAGSGLSSQMMSIPDPGPLFLLSTNASGNAGPVMGPAVNGTGAAPEDDQAPANEIHYELGMSGRSGGKDYDIVLMDILVDVDPAKLNAFMDELYKRNPGYTVSSVQCKTVDPLDRASSGYLYGEDQVVEAEITLECMFFRKWTRPLMPDNESALLGLAPYKAPAQENH